MKLSFKHLLSAALLIAMPLTFTSCEGALDDILGEWSRPTPGSSTGGGSDSGTVTAATITTAPTATTGDILDGSTTALVTAGVADGGTVMYKATSETEPKPTTTDGFSAEIPTAAGLAVGTYFVWYYAKAADAQHSDSEIAATPVKVTVQPSLSTPLTIEAITAGTITVTDPQPGMKYSKNGAAKTNVGITSISVAAGDKVAFYGTDACYYNTYIRGDGDDFKCKVYGNIMSLVDETGFAKNTTLTADKTFQYLFSSNAKLTDASGLLLPAMTLTTSCYYEMFYGCANLTAAPKELPAKELKSDCYYEMFYGCANLTETPKLPAETAKLASNCYYGMFQNCTSLTTAYVKAAYTDTNSECTNMFNGCTAAGAKLHTTTANITSWADVMGSGHHWSAWTAVADWND